MLDDIVNDTIELSESTQSKMLFYLMGNLNGYFKYDLDNSKTLNKNQCYDLVKDSYNAVNC